MRLRDGFQVGLGYRRALHDAVLAAPEGAIDFLELAPENYAGAGGALRRRLDAVRERYPIVTHGLALSLGGEAPLDARLIELVAPFVERVGSPWHSDHLCWSSTEDAHLHELLPIPFTRARAELVASRAREMRSKLTVPFAVENVSAYARHPEDELSEGAFVREVIERSGAKLLLDVNNVFVNATNFGADAFELLWSMPLESVVQIHVAGFRRERPDLLIDTHGAPIEDGVFELLRAALARTGPVPVLLERDHDIPPLEALLEEVERVRAIGREALL